MAAIVEELSKHFECFHGRGKELEALEALVPELQARGEYLLITAPEGWAKFALLAAFTERLARAGGGGLLGAGAVYAR